MRFSENRQTVEDTIEINRLPVVEELSDDQHTVHRIAPPILKDPEQRYQIAVLLHELSSHSDTQTPHEQFVETLSILDEVANNSITPELFMISNANDEFVGVVSAEYIPAEHAFPNSYIQDTDKNTFHPITVRGTSRKNRDQDISSSNTIPIIQLLRYHQKQTQELRENSIYPRTLEYIRQQSSLVGSNKIPGPIIIGDIEDAESILPDQALNPVQVDGPVSYLGFEDILYTRDGDNLRRPQIFNLQGEDLLVEAHPAESRHDFSARGFERPFVNHDLPFAGAREIFVTQFRQQKEKAAQKLPDFTTMMEIYSNEILSDPNATKSEIQAAENLLQQVEDGTFQDDIHNMTRAALERFTISMTLMPLIGATEGMILLLPSVTEESFLVKTALWVLAYEFVPGLGGLSVWPGIGISIMHFSIPMAREFYRRRMEEIKDQSEDKTNNILSKVVRSEKFAKLWHLTLMASPAALFFDGGWALYPVPLIMSRPELLPIIGYKAKEFTKKVYRTARNLLKGREDVNPEDIDPEELATQVIQALYNNN